MFLLSSIVLFSSCQEKPGEPLVDHADQQRATDSIINALSLKLSADSSDFNFNELLQAVTNDSLKNSLLSTRRKMFMSYNSFQKLGIDAEEFLRENPCYTPLITKMDRINDKHFVWADLYNESFPGVDYRSRRFIVADFNTLNSRNQCKGCTELYPQITELTELKSFLALLNKESVSLTDDAAIAAMLSNKWKDTTITAHDIHAIWKNLRDHVEQFRTEPMKKDSVITVNNKQYCLGQMLCLCEIYDDTLMPVAKFVTSSKNSKAPHFNQHDFDGQPRYYAPMNRLTTRYWDNKIKYDSLDIIHDKMMGFSSSSVILYQGRVQLPNFMHITPDDAYPGAKGYVNGIHEFAVGGSEPGKYMGAPLSLGCVRLHDYPSKFIRWWTPANAKMFIAYEFSRYKQNPLSNNQTAQQ